MILSWLRRRRRKRLLATPFPSAWLACLELVPHYRRLDPRQQARLRDQLRIFVAEKNWEGCAGLEVTDEMKIVIAAHACLMTLGLEGEPFGGLLSILIYPSSYLVPEERWYENWSIARETAHLGQSWYRGPVILAWAEVERDARHPGRGRNLVWHEFAHQLDMLDRSTNGTPPLADSTQRRRWHDVMTAEYEQLVAAAQQGRATLLDTYGADSEAEFFAVASECFFDRGADLRRQHPGLYQLLAEYYHQDPAAREPW
ncbi:MAG TPA: M90 family metallopeptidase [Pirellulales bacterium]|nr:M90 family metallopeptidase [Pirellulales bacterium]